MSEVSELSRRLGRRTASTRKLVSRFHRTHGGGQQQKQVSSSMSTVFVIQEKKADAIESDLEGWKKIDGEPTMKTWIEYATDEALCGTWEATLGTYRVTYKSWEYAHLIEGKIIIRPEGGEPYTVIAGDSFVIEKGFTGTWKIEENVKKHFTKIIGTDSKPEASMEKQRSAKGNELVLGSMKRSLSRRLSKSTPSD